MPDPHPSGADPFSRPRPDPSRLGFKGRIGWAAASLISLLFRFAFHLLYHPLAFTYDAVAWIVSAGEWADWRRCVIPYLPPGPVLEIAHGTGTLSLDMSERGYPVIAVDLSPAMGRIARGKIRKWQSRRRSGNSIPAAARISRAADGPLLVRADVQRLPLPAGSFASATATFPADFLFQMRTFREVHRALRPGGRWIILPTAFPEWLAKRWMPDEDPDAHSSLWSTTRRALEGCGFSVRMEIVRRPRSRVLIILAEKKSTKIHGEKPEGHEGS
jgi:ubiquinone/menaquinone biosynthesis C-methylase UbiE